MEAAKLTESYLKSDEEYTKFYQKVLQSSQGLTDNPVLSRRAKSVSMMELIHITFLIQRIIIGNTTLKHWMRCRMNYQDDLINRILK